MIRYKKRYFLAIYLKDFSGYSFSRFINDYFLHEDPLLFFMSKFSILKTQINKGKVFFIFKVANKYKYAVIFILSRLGGIVTLKNSGSIKKIKRELEIWSRLEM
ncbi:MAG: hypothetical protein QXX36_00530 [Candidatus Rehaiarchaeum fermentans]|nr:hypothetical protein [Candidatus Rehaiarchaeum fermentans]MCW1293570.1 hypothetical protein [Candidatus Rehaiarchaeum fermentans]MCW1297387.1 hypothetical protein [Candidatus Rehaiarchaeum fermentans]MCW1302112.1 hypothetical protein [Candidatus Rehaiarchaeum fermentans]